MRRAASVRRWTLGLCASALLLVAACTEEPERQPRPPAEAPPDSGRESGRPATLLNGTYWRLVEIRGAQGDVLQPEDPEEYIFNFRADGVLAMKLNCNRASAPWSVEPVKEGKGRLTVGPPVATRAYCPPPTLDERIATSVNRAAFYALDGERLLLGLTGGGAYVLEPAEERAGGGAER